MARPRKTDPRGAPARPADTIFAPATGRGRAGIAVLRLSGPQAGPALAHLTGGELPKPRQAHYASICSHKGEMLDRGLVLWFPGPASFTGEDVAELHLHGSRAVLAAVAAELVRMPGLRLAEPGEFSRRAFEHGKLDLTAAEGLADLINAETEAQRRQALRQMDGGLARLYDGWRETLLNALAHWEASIDFADEDLPDDLEAQVRPGVEALAAALRRHLNDGHRGERLREGLHIAILGAPNVGKSSLLNALARRDVAIVSDEAGTTRDVLEVHLDLGGLPVTLADTAGLRETGHVVESEGIRRARARAEAADLGLIVLDAQQWPKIPDEVIGLIEQGKRSGSAHLMVLNKTDLNPPSGPVIVAGLTAMPVSAKTGSGMTDLLGALARIAEDRLADTGTATLTRERHRVALSECFDHLSRFLSGDHEPELKAEDLRLAARALGRITGRVDVEQLLDRIFRDFCIGK